MKQLVEVIAKSLVENPDEVVVTETEKDDAIVVELKSDRPIWARSSEDRKNCQGNPYRCKGGFFKKQQKK